MHPSHKILTSFDSDFRSVREVQRLVKKQHGFDRIGYGAYTSTYGKKRLPYVIKINETCDPAAFKFYSMIARTDSPYFPKVYKLKSYVDVTGKFLFVAIVERLHDVNKHTWKRVNEEGRGFASWIASRKDAELEFVENDDDHDYRDLAIRWKKKNLPSIKIVSSIIKATSNFASTDLYDCNVMMRLPVGDVVLTDPIFPNDDWM